MTGVELTEAERVKVSAVVHQNYMPDVFSTVEQIIAARLASMNEAGVAAIRAEARAVTELEAEVARLTALVEAGLALVRSPETDWFRYEACRGVVALPYASNRYVRLLDDIRAVLGGAK